ncbi:MULTISPECIES: hypothetical protein [Acidithiobacillus]|uniref:Putative integrase/recombinase y4rC n=1 Tax=Acidithiobacillus thiooxidans ATCC 19377 TaxID=637390 RepID=A0A543Q4P3_ACITH|nr:MULTISPECIES: hypothetical protein [Acidithiobacillus]MCR2830266.1 hypothetical protein [Acidithiobacillus ferrooxidans]MDX5934586.1 hypothetical protein [Acidithiobacillus thiooxidans]TQN51297.1 putative integrase/recombinase y4rC [Acidithiobacillus thiooxidans ATCC 19377]
MKPTNPLYSSPEEFILASELAPHMDLYKAMHLLQSGVGIDVIALWLGHENPATTHHYVEADLAMKDRALAHLQEPCATTSRYHAPDSLMEFLKGL